MRLWVERFYSWNRNACLSWEKHVGKFIGKAEGKAEGEAIGETRMRMLINRLIADGRMDEIGKIIDSAEACRELYKEYGL